MNIRLAAVAALFSVCALAQKTDQGTVFKYLDASGATLTKPFRLVGSDPTGSCSANGDFVLGPTGTISKCISGTWAVQGSGTGSGTTTIQANGSTVGTRGTVDFIPGTGVSQTLIDTGSKITVQTDISAAVQTKASAQSGAHLLCSAGSASPLTCSMSPTLTAYTDKMLVNLCVTGAITGATTLNIDTLGAKSVLSFAGANPASGDLGIGCRLVTYKSSDNSFRLPAGGSGGGGGITTTNASVLMPVGGCKTNQDHGIFFLWGVDASVGGDCRGPNSSQPVMIFDNNSNGSSARYYFRMPQDWNGSGVNFVFRESQLFGANGAIKWDVSLSCQAVNSTYDSFTFNTATSITVTNNSILNSYERTFSGIDATGCTAGQAAALRISRDTTVASNISDVGQGIMVTFPEMRYTRQ